MASSTTRLLLRKPDGDPVTGDNIDVDLDISASMDKIDDAVGAHICTSGTRPTAAQRWDGRIIKETDTKRMYVWDAGLSFWMPLLNGRGSGIGPYLLGTSTDTGGEGINLSGSAAATNMWRSRVGSEANPRFTIDADGSMNWGAGGASAVDTRLYRSAADTLRTPDNLTIDGILNAASFTQFGYSLARTAAQTIPLTTFTPISWDTETVDTPANFTPHATTGTTITLPANGGGIWALCVVLTMAGAPTGLSMVSSTFSGLGGLGRAPWTDNVSTLAMIVPLAGSSTVQIQAYRSGGGSNVTGNLFLYRIA